MKKILFVCLGNICRSSTAEGVMLHLIKEAGLEKEFVIDSAGILSYHQGELPDSRMRAHAARRGYQLVHRSRPVRTEDFYNFDLIIGMDDRNIDDLKEKAPSTEEWKKIHRMTEYCTRIPADHVPDPYYGNNICCHLNVCCLINIYMTISGPCLNYRNSAVRNYICNKCCSTSRNQNIDPTMHLHHLIYNFSACIFYEKNEILG